MIKINKWWDEFENATSRKLKNVRYFTVQSGNDSKGYRSLIRKGESGLIAFGVFQSLCQLMATLSHDARKRGEMIHSNGCMMDLDDISDLTRISTETLEASIKRLIEIGWLDPLDSTIAGKSATDLPSSPINLPSSPTDLPPSTQGRGGEGKGEEGKGNTSPSGDGVTISEKAEIVWNNYPRKIGKKKAIDAIKKAIRSIDYKELADIVAKFAEAKKFTDSQYIPHGSTWFGQQRYLDDPDEWEDKAAEKPKHDPERARKMSNPLF